MTPNTHFATYDASGRILTTGVCQVETLELQGPLVYAGLIDPETHYMDVGTGLPTALPPRPSTFHAFNYEIKQWELDLQRAWNFIRQKRNELLAASDWTEVSPRLTEEKKVEWQNYRDFLFDEITNQPDPTNISWPVKPE